MKDSLPPPDPDPSQYVRPTQNWICGKSPDGQACRIGPDARGHCRAGSECMPKLETFPGETKGRYKCNRPDDHGGPCEHGPRSDGSCGRPITRCQPVRSLRAQRRVLTWVVITATVALFLLAIGGPKRWAFINPGPLSSQHSGAGFSKAAMWSHAGLAPDDPGCAACHVSAHAGPAMWVKKAIETDPGPFHRHTLALMTTAETTSIDQACERCHLGHTFHEPNVIGDRSCAACHHEHQGQALLNKPADVNCTSCHGDAQIMAASAEKGRHLPAVAFDQISDAERISFATPRPESGFTEVIHSFATDHPEFRVLRQKMRDPDTLKFNHQLHLTSPTVPLLNGRKLVCGDCHVPDVAGQYHGKLSFEENCRVCHSLQFDAKNPELRLPHGSVDFVRDFLRSLPTQYGQLGRSKGLVTHNELETFVREQMKQLRAQVPSGEELEQQVFFGDNSGTRARFPACNYCHQVSATSTGLPVVMPPTVVDRWMTHGRFDHKKHLSVDCVKCHAAMQSTGTSDVLLPSRLICVECHSPKGGVANGCSECHTYHAPIKAITVKAEATEDKLAEVRR